METRLIVVFIFLSFSLFGQHSKIRLSKAAKLLLPESMEWHEGSLMLIDGTGWDGLLKYNERTGIVYCLERGEIKSLSSLDISSFEFWDEKTRMPRLFYTFSYNEGTADNLARTFFEVIIDCETFTLLSKIDPPEIKTKNSSPGPYNSQTGQMGPGMTGHSTPFISVTETIYMMDLGGKIEPYFKIIDKDNSKAKYKMLNKHLLVKHAGPFYERLVSYAKRNDLKFTVKEDLLEILKYYAVFVSDQNYWNLYGSNGSYFKR